MAWSTPLTITINSIAYALNRINNDNFGSEWVYRDANRQITMKIRHSTDAPNKLTGRINLRHNVQVIHRVFSTSTTKEFIRTWNHTIVCPDDDDPAAVLLDAQGITAATVTTTHLTDMIAGLN